MSELMEGGRKIVVHGDVAGTLVIIPVERESAIAGTGPVDRNVVHIFEGLDEMVCVFSAYIFDAKIVDDQR